MLTGAIYILDHHKKIDTVVAAYKNWVARHRGKHISKDELDLVVEALFLTLVVETENILDDFFWKILTGQISQHSKFKVVQVFRDEISARKVIINDQYISWLPVAEIDKKTSRYFRHENPLARCGPGIKDDLAKLTKIRNFIAHRSDVSFLLLKDFVPVTHRPLSKSGSISPYLRSSFQTISWFERYAECTKQWIAEICAPS